MTPGVPCRKEGTVLVWVPSQEADAPLWETEAVAVPAVMAVLPWLRSDARCVMGATDAGETCCVCLQDLEDGDRIHELSCGHRFHRASRKCPGVKPWLRKRGTCPLCRQQ
jgi:hypothetical protein